MSRTASLAFTNGGGLGASETLHKSVDRFRRSPRNLPLLADHALAEVREQEAPRASLGGVSGGR